MKIRLDRLVVERGLASSRERAQALILAGRVLVDERKMEKPGSAVREDAALRLLGEERPFVSRGGAKLDAAIAHWGVSLAGVHCADIGASTGGFTDCMLQHGAASVTAIDTGYGQIAHRLRTDPRVVLRERTNARRLPPRSLNPAIGFFAIDVSFISATLVLPAVLDAIASPPNTLLTGIVLVKPQFEAGREHVGKGGIVRDPAAHRLAIERVKSSAAALGAAELGLLDSPLLGAQGNREFLLCLSWLK